MSLLVFLPDGINVCIVALQCNFAHGLHLNKLRQEIWDLKKSCSLTSLLSSLDVQIKPITAPTSATLVTVAICSAICTNLLTVIQIIFEKSYTFLRSSAPILIHVENNVG